MLAPARGDPPTSAPRGLRGHHCSGTVPKSFWQSREAAQVFMQDLHKHPAPRRAGMSRSRWHRGDRREVARDAALPAGRG